MRTRIDDDGGEVAPVEQVEEWVDGMQPPGHAVALATLCSVGAVGVVALLFHLGVL